MRGSRCGTPRRNGQQSAQRLSKQTAEISHMSYPVGRTELYQWGQDATFGATAVLHYIMGPRGAVGFVKDLICDVTTSLVGTTTVPEIQVGISSGDFTYGRYRLGTTAILGYPVAPHRARDEAWTGNPPVTLADFAGHVVLDGGPVTSQGVAGGSYGTVVPSGRIPAGPLTVTNVVNGTANVCRVYLNGLTPAPGGLLVGSTVLVQGVSGATGANGKQTISAIDTTSISNGGPQWIELASATFGGTYTSGGFVMPIVVVTLQAGVGGSPAGGGFARVEIEWLTQEH